MQTPKAALVRMFIAVIILSIMASCQKMNSPLEELPLANSGNNKAETPATPNFNLEVILRSAGESFGHVKFRQDNDAAKIITLGVWVRDLAPNHQYLLQRAVDTNLDGDCTSTSWLTLGKGLVPQAIITDDKGTGTEDLWRDVSAIASGTTFDIHFRVIDAVTQAVVLTSDCYQYTVR